MREVGGIAAEGRQSSWCSCLSYDWAEGRVQVSPVEEVMLTERAARAKAL
jgi:hypothetical protein